MNTIQTTTKYQTYPKYKPSGIDWLGDIPEGWEAKRLRYFFDYHAGGVWGDEEKGDQNDLICLRVADFDFDHFGLSKDDLTTRNIPENQHSRILEKGDILLEKSGGGEKQTVGRAVRFDSDSRAVCSNFIEKLTPHKIHDSKYISYLMGALYFGTINVRSIKQTTGIQNLDIYSYFSEVVPFPEKTIQGSIADFLDRETAKIDEVVGKKQKLMELLKEKRQALITHAVTKGLDPKAKMKPSGIDWLGDIPEGWEVKKLKHVASYIGSGKTPRGGSEVYLDEGVMLLRSQNVYDDGLKLEDVAFIDEKMDLEMYSTRVNPLDVLLNITGASIGRSSIVPIGFSRANVNQHVCIIRPNISAILSSYLHLVIVSQFTKDQINADENGTSREGLNFQQVGNLLIIRPPIKEQQVIFSFLDRETAKIDEMMKKVETQIEKLKEYRQALITCAVTGKIMVN